LKILMTERQTDRQTDIDHEATVKKHYAHHTNNLFNLAAKAIILHIRELQKRE